MPIISPTLNPHSLDNPSQYALAQDIIQNHCINRIPESHPEPTQNQTTNDQTSVPYYQKPRVSQPTLPFVFGEFGLSPFIEEQMSIFFYNDRVL